jgi:predicted esterase YcpF (UPF0227 family)
MIVYLHGFRSSPASNKARALRAAMVRYRRADEWLCPQLPVSPRTAVDGVLAQVERIDPSRLCLIGSSLGGYYATWIAERTGCAAVLLNPAVRPFEDLQTYLGTQTVYFSDARIEVRPEHMAELRALDTPQPTRLQRYLLVAATGDEVIDYRQMVAKYAGCRQHVIAGSDHSIADFDQYLDEVLEYCFAWTGEGQ